MEDVRQLRLRELSCDDRMASVRCGLASVIPLQLLKILTPADLDLRVCGVPDINLDYLRVRPCLQTNVFNLLLFLFVVVKKHTKYHVGLEETDRHVQFFWEALESFSQVCVCVCVCVCGVCV